MALLKALIVPDKQPPVPVFFNPTQYTLEEGNEIAELGVPGRGSPILQFVRGGARRLSMDLFFDTYEPGLDVREHTSRVYGLLAIDRTTHAPPVCTFTWGRFAFRGVLERVNGRFTLFLSTGTPVRATLSVSFCEHVDPRTEARRNPLESPDRRKLRTVRGGDTLSGIAAAEYGDPRAWRPIAEANGIDNPRRLQPGQTLALPALR